VLLAFPEYTTHRHAFEERRDASDSWEVSFYRSLSRADGVALIGADNLHWSQECWL
jgi:hypothetical protein